MQAHPHSHGRCRQRREALRRLVALAALALGGGPGRVVAQAGQVAPATPVAQWPEKPVRLIVAGVPGGAADLLARLLAEQLGKDSGATVITEPKPGAGGILAVTELAQAPRDGQHLLVAVNSLVSEIPHIVKTRLDMAREVVPLAELARGGLVLVAHPTFPARSLAELVAYARPRPGQLHYASYTAGTVSHLLGLLLNQAAGIELVHVGYKGSTPALQDVMGGHVPLMFDAMPTALPLVRAGRLKALAVSLPQRSPLLPEVPSFSELGYPQMEAVAWMGLWARPELPAAQRAQMRAAVLQALARPGVRERLLALGFEPGSGRDAEALGQALRTDFERMGGLLKSIGFKPE